MQGFQTRLQYSHHEDRQWTRAFASLRDMRMARLLFGHALQVLSATFAQANVTWALEDTFRFWYTDRQVTHTLPDRPRPIDSQVIDTRPDPIHIEIDRDPYLLAQQQQQRVDRQILGTMPERPLIIAVEHNFENLLPIITRARLKFVHWRTKRQR